MKLWPVAPFFHFFLYHFWLGLLLHPPKSDKKMKKRGNWSEFHFSEVTSYKIHTLVVSLVVFRTMNFLEMDGTIHPISFYKIKT